MFFINILKKIIDSFNINNSFNVNVILIIMRKIKVIKDNLNVKIFKELLLIIYYIESILTAIIEWIFISLSVNNFLKEFGELFLIDKIVSVKSREIIIITFIMKYIAFNNLYKTFIKVNL